jgi:hypothetical protein
LHYQWRFNGDLIGSATDSTFTIENGSVAQSGSYSVVVSNVFGAATSAPVVVTIFVPREPELKFAVSQRFEDGRLMLQFEHDFPDDTQTLNFESSTNLVDWTHLLTRSRWDPTTIDFWIDPPTDKPQFYIRAKRWPSVSGE